MQETQIWQLGGEDPLEKEMAVLSSILVWEIPWTDEPSGHGLWGHQGVGHDLATKEEESKMGGCISEPRCLLSIKNTPEILLLRVLFCRSVTTSCLALQLHGLQHARLPRPSPSPGVCWNSCPLNRWCHPTISSSVTPFFSCPQACPAPGSFPVSRLFISSGQSVAAFCSSPSLIQPFTLGFCFSSFSWCKVSCGF